MIVHYFKDFGLYFATFICGWGDGKYSKYTTKKEEVTCPECLKLM